MSTRRRFLAAAAAAPLALAAAHHEKKRPFTAAFTPGSIGVTTDQKGAIELAETHGFGSVQPFAEDLAKLEESRRKEAGPLLKERHGLVWAAAGLPVDFRTSESKFREGLAELKKQAPIYEQAGVTRMGTWMMPMHEELTYLQYFKQTSKRLREIGAVLGDHGLRLGLEYVGTPGLRIQKRYQFVHSMAETKELIAEVGSPHLGFVLDSWHWWTAGETKADILSLRGEDVVSADLNDAPAGLEMLQQHDTTRELPLATGVIPVKDFLSALVEIGYDGPIRPEPFNKNLNAMENAEASKTAGAAMNKAFALVG